MKLYFVAVAIEPESQSRDLIKAGVKHSLVSAVDLYSGDKPVMRDNMKRRLLMSKGLGVELFLDSGAFGIFSLKMQGKPSNNMTNLARYMEFVSRYRKYFDVIAALDVIDSHEKSYSNYVYMRMQGFDDVVPCFHKGEPLSALEKYIGKTDYIGLGGLAGSGERSDRNGRAAYIRRALDFIHEKDRHMKIHLYGVMDLRLLRLFAVDVESADSTSWLQGQKYAGLVDINGGIISKKYMGRLNHHFTRSNNYNVYQMVKSLNEINEYKEKVLRERQVTSISH